jgi:hypothetical protein
LFRAFKIYHFRQLRTQVRVIPGQLFAFSKQTARHNLHSLNCEQRTSSSYSASSPSATESRIIFQENNVNLSTASVPQAVDHKAMPSANEEYATLMQIPDALITDEADRREDDVTSVLPPKRDKSQANKIPAASHPWQSVAPVARMSGVALARTSLKNVV